ncbi:MAG: efflux RND transporter periplasmic adaptor subunit [Candidatus Hydrogenedentota bacterium]
MHPEVRMPNPDDLCPTCGMELIPLDELDEDEEEDDDIPRLQVSERARALMQIQTAPAERRAAEQELRLFGRVDYDETRTNDVTLLADGQIQRLRIDYSNARVREGDHLADVYSPEVLGAAEEFLVAARAGDRRGTDVLERQARRRLTLLGVTPPEIEEILEQGETDDTYRVYSPASGVITELGAQEGDWVNQGRRLMRIVDLDQVWVQLEAYERDLQWLRYGQSIEFTTEAYPGEVFEGQIAFISPTVDQDRRTVRVRANVDNPDGKLKPDMFLRGTVHSQVAAGGRVMAPELAGKWVSPTHPEIIRDGPGECPRSGRPLVRAEDLGYTAASPGETEMPLLIPKTAPLITGERAVVYVEIPGEDRPTFEGRDITLGARPSA